MTSVAVGPDGAVDPQAALALLAESSTPTLVGVRHHGPALAVALPELLAAAGTEVLCVELPVDFQQWIVHLGDPETVAPVALAGVCPGDEPGFYPFADFSPELVAIRWARAHGIDVVCCDLPLAGRREVRVSSPEEPEPPSPVPVSRSFARALSAATSGRDDDLWDRCVEVMAPGQDAQAVRRAGLAVGWALRADAVAAGGIREVDLAREEYMRAVIARAGASGRRVTAVVGAFHTPALMGCITPPAPDQGSPADLVPHNDTADVMTSLVPYSFDLLDSRSGYPAGIRDPRWQQAVLDAGGDPDRIGDALAAAITDVCRELRRAGHPAGTGEAIEAVRLAGDLARLRGLPAPGRGELIEAVSSVHGQGDSLGRGFVLAKALERVLIGAQRGRITPGAPRSGLGPSVERELAALRMPHPHEPTARELRLDPLRSDLDRRRVAMLHQLEVCGVEYGTRRDVTGPGDRTALTTRWRVAWTPTTAIRLDLAATRGVTARHAAAGTLRERFRAEQAAGGASCTEVIDGLEAAAQCALPELVADRCRVAVATLPAAATVPELLRAIGVAEALSRGHLPGGDAQTTRMAAHLVPTALDAAVRALPGLAGSDRTEDAVALVDVAVRAANRRIGLRLVAALDHLTALGSPLIQGAAHAARVLVSLATPSDVGMRAAGWVDSATTSDSRRRLGGLLSGLLGALAPIMESAPTTLDPLLDRIESLPDREFLDRLPALRGGFDGIAPAGRAGLLEAVADRLGDRLDTALTVSGEELARWTAADLAAHAVLEALGLACEEPAPHIGHEPVDDQRGDGPSRAESVDRTPQVSALAVQRISVIDRWRLVLGRESEELSPDATRYSGALDELYGTGRGEGAHDFTAGGGRRRSFPSARSWSEELDALFGSTLREEVLAQAAGQGRVDVLTELDPASVRPSVELLTSVLSLAGGMPEQQLTRLRPLVRRLVAELSKELATTLRPALTGVGTPRPTSRPGGRLDLARTLRANLAHTTRGLDGVVQVIPQKPVFASRSRNESDWRLILVTDVSGSMEASVVWSALTAAVLGSVPTLSTHFLAFSTEVIDLSEHVTDPLSLLLEVRVGGGTHIARALAHARSLVTVPSRTMVAVVSDFEEGYALGGLLGEVRALVASGVRVIGCAALDDSGAARYSVPVAGQLVAAGMPVAALSPLALAQWVGQNLRGENR